MASDAKQEVLYIRVSAELRAELDARLEVEKRTRSWLTFSDLIRELVVDSLERKK